MALFPTLFISHGPPNLGLHESPARDFLSGFGKKLGRPQAIIVVSAHFDMVVPSVSADEAPGILYDFDGFEEAAYAQTYPAPGLPQLASIAATLIEQSGFPVQEIIGRGLDHGVFGPLSLMYPEADIPVVQMAVQSAEGTGHHIALGRALASLRHHGILLIGSGSLTHNLEKILNSGGESEANAPEWVQSFADWVLQKAEAGLIDEIADYKALAPHALENHPTAEHFLPLPFAMGAAGEGAKGTRVHSSVQYGAMMMDSYIFE